VVERRQEIGVMRAIGFEQGMVQLSFLIESSMVALAGIGLGTLLGLIIAFNVIQDSRSDGSWEALSFTVPWLNFLIIYGLVYGAALATSYLPARRASRCTLRKRCAMSERSPWRRDSHGSQMGPGRAPKGVIQTL
jgi:putative ABC transport system permease protein